MSLKKNCSVLMISNKMSAAKEADRILVLDNGVVTEDGSHQQLMERGGLYATLVEKQEKGISRQEEENADDERTA